MRLGRLRRGGWKRSEVEEAKEVREVRNDERSRTRQRIAQRSQRTRSSLRGERRKLVAAIPRLRGPTRQNAARKRKSSRSARDDRFWVRCSKGARFSSAAGKRNDGVGGEAQGHDGVGEGPKSTDRSVCATEDTEKRKAGDGDGMEDAGGVGGP